MMTVLWAPRESDIQKWQNARIDTMEMRCYLNELNMNPDMGKWRLQWEHKFLLGKQANHTHTNTSNLNNGTKANNLNASLNCIHTWERVHVHIFKCTVCNHVFPLPNLFTLNIIENLRISCVFLGKRNECHPTHRLWKVNAFTLRESKIAVHEWTGEWKYIYIHWKHAEI